MCFGDLNDSIGPEDKAGGNSRSSSQLNFGRDTVRDCSLIDLGFEGYPFTWSNGRKGSENIQGRLDRALCNEVFQLRFSPISVIHLAKFGSDDAALSINLEDHRNNQLKRKQNIFRFEE